ncbi:hypothetical protein Ahia01_001003700 [Argonauta hians]
MLAIFDRLTISPSDNHPQHCSNTSSTTFTTNIDQCSDQNSAITVSIPTYALATDKNDCATTSIITTIPFQPQRYNWDCGLACCCMVLRYLGKDVSSVYQSDLDRLQCGQSVWTIHLAYLLKHHGVKTDFFTVTLGVDHSYAEQKFYQKHFDADEMKINRLFHSASAAGVSVTMRSVELSTILHHLQDGHLVICLVDSGLIPRQHNILTQSSSNVPCVPSSGDHYQGHYIVVCGYNEDQQQIYFRNPAMRRDGVCSCCWKTFELARTRYGTDEDILFIYTTGR